MLRVFLLFLISACTHFENAALEINPIKEDVKKVKYKETKLSCTKGKDSPLKIISSRRLQTGKTFVKAGSGIALVGKSLYVIQDSSRFLAEVNLDPKVPIKFHPLASPEVIKQFEDENLPYAGFRKERKADHEAITTLPDGRLLITSSGYDAAHIETDIPHYKNGGGIFNPKDNTFEAIDLAPFFQHLLDRPEVVGKRKKGLDPRLNIEGILVFEGNKIAFFNRSNFNKNSHDSASIYALDEWLAEVKKPVWSLEELDIVTIDFKRVKDRKVKFPITLTDAALADDRGNFYLPLASEADHVIDGKDVDGEVVWTGVAKVNIVGKKKTCIHHSFTDKMMPKIEGLVMDPSNPSRFYAVHDIDDENLPSDLSILEISF